MTQPLPRVIQANPGQPASVRVGRITSVNPFVLTVQGAEFNSDAVGVLGSYIPVLDDVVSVLGQSSASGSDPSSWLILGEAKAIGAAAGLTLSLVRMSTSTAVLNLVAAQTTITGTSISFDTSRDSATLVAWWHADFEAIGATLTTGVCHLVVDGITQAPQAIWEMPTAAASGRVTAGQTEVVTLASSGSHTVNLAGNRAGGADNQIRINNIHTTLTIFVYE
jgi:hypothetical protein